MRLNCSPARAGLQEQVLRNEQLKLRLAKLLRERFGASSEKLRTAIEQLELILGDLEEQIAEPAPEPQQPAAPEPADTARRKPARQPLPEYLPRTTVEHAAPCACPKCGGALHRLGEDVTDVLDYVPSLFRVIRHVRPKLSCRGCDSIAQAPAPSMPIHRGLATPALRRMCWWRNMPIIGRCIARPRSMRAVASNWIVPPSRIGWGKRPV